MGHDGYFPETSLLRRVQSERVVGSIYGQRALMLGAMASPLSYYGTSAHSAGKLTPFKRLVHTANMFEDVFFGPRERADRTLAIVRRMHERVKGKLPEDLGPWPAGTPYSALDPELMLTGVVGPTFDSALTVYERLVRPLTADEREALWADYLRFGELFGMPREAAPRTYLGFREWWDERLEGPEVLLTEEARVAGYMTGFEIPVPTLNRVGMVGIEFLLTGLLPRRARELYGLQWGAVQQRAFEAAAAAHRQATRVAPARLRRGSCRALYDQVARTERSRVHAGQPVATLGEGPDAPSPLRVAAS